VVLTPEAGVVGEPFTFRVEWTPSAFLGAFFGRLLRERNWTNGGFPSSFSLALDAAHQLTDFVVG